ncbi:MULTISPECIES: NADPH-dependent FMN reductase [Vibrio]|uniref:NADPH-dependent FMN reductase n=1 Tax=Vibrio TaxID=662 RepID=UPI001EFE71D8|nr:MULTISPECIES: NAD(P)H-dependent oxidoreductase [Vibrio]MCG9676738.1 NAD(P)H-dependent oxidoreductase [Vibrio sp. Isolate24]USD34885.1 NAD(P)H-dependent oxidoreductase [Vibrio sp. SCSIO 43186]USD47950.1 NAD(P)H-dependent oxidoreductase [Vibrio sp. SCSIO 43145]USD72009.1 NAD(P)H-dependent oxidoreductase [Vibrio sp. SCSIO 43139]USD97677.1 NADPH-dependent FMN reductase [Vibrio coralliilyticus]
MKVLAFGASSSKHSINQKLAFYAAKQIEGADISLIDINDYEMPIFSEDREKELGSPQQAQLFFKAIGEADIVVISFAEHNGSYTAAYKNLFDWTSRINMKVFQNKPVILLATSPGAGGASSVLNTAQGSAPYFAADVKGALSLPNFYDNFDIEEGVVTNQAFNQQLLAIVQAL